MVNLVIFTTALAKVCFNILVNESLTQACGTSTLDRSLSKSHGPKKKKNYTLMYSIIKKKGRKKRRKRQLDFIYSWAIYHAISVRIT